MTVKETLDFSARCQGVGTRYGNSKQSPLTPFSFKKNSVNNLITIFFLIMLM